MFPGFFAGMPEIFFYYPSGSDIIKKVKRRLYGKIKHRR